MRIELKLRRRAGESPSHEDYSSRFPDSKKLIEHVFSSSGDTPALAETVGLNTSPVTDTSLNDNVAWEETFVPGSPLQSGPASVDPFQTTFGDYELIHEIARGGMGVVFKARQMRLNRIVALKMIRSGELAGHEEILRFQTEAEAAARLDHPHIVPIYEVGEQNGLHFFSMGFVEGKGLDSRLKDGPLPPKEAAELMQTIAAAIQYAHEKGIVHRDLKPANVLLDSGNNPRITDFGLAKNIAGDSGMTATGQVMGTPSYMPPEQASGRTEEIGPLVDVYSLGAMLYALLAGRPPFQAANVIETLVQVCEQEPVSPRILNPAVDKDLETICLKCLEKDASRRYASSADVAADLGRYLKGKPIMARPIGVPLRMWRWCLRNPMATALTALLMVLAVTGPAVALYQIGLNRRLDTALAGETKQRKNAETKEKEAIESERGLRVALKKEQDALLQANTAIAQRNEQAKISEVEQLARKKAEEFASLSRAENPAFAQIQNRLADSQSKISSLYEVAGKPSDALSSYQQAMAIWEQLAREHPKVATYQSALPARYKKLVRLAHLGGKPAQARTALERLKKLEVDLASATVTPPPTVLDQNEQVIIPNSWETISYRNRQANLSISRQFSKSGQISAKVIAQPDHADDIRFSQTVKVAKNQWHHLSGWVKTSDVRLQVGKDEVGANLSIIAPSKHTRSLLGTNDWTFVAFVFDSQDQDEIQIAARLGYHGGTCSGIAWFDDLCLIPIDPPEDPMAESYQKHDFLAEDRKSLNLLDNADFELLPKDHKISIDEWLCPNFWDFSSYQQRIENFGVSRQFAKSGETSAKLVAQPDHADDIKFIQTVNVASNRWHHLSGWVKTADVRLQEEKHAIGANLSILGPSKRTRSMMGMNDWTFVAVVFDTQDREQIQIAARLGYNAGACSGAAWFDDLCLISIDPPEDPMAEIYQQPDFLTDERREANLLQNANFERVPAFED